jgi:hypothetical protein
MSEAINLPLEEQHREPSGTTSRVMPRARALALLDQASAAIENGGRGEDITRIPSGELLVRYRLMRRGV